MAECYPYWIQLVDLLIIPLLNLCLATTEMVQISGKTAGIVSFVVMGLEICKMWLIAQSRENPTELLGV